MTEDHLCDQDGCAPGAAADNPDRELPPGDGPPAIHVGPRDPQWWGQQLSAIPAPIATVRRLAVLDGAEPLVVMLAHGPAGWVVVQTAVAVLDSAWQTALLGEHAQRPVPRLTDQRRVEALARVLSHLDRCLHGRHEGDVCAGYRPGDPMSGCPGGRSLGNPLMPTGARMGTDLYGLPIFMPGPGERHVPQAYTRQPDATLAPPGQPIDADEAAAALGQPLVLVQMWRMTGASFYRTADAVLVCQGTVIVGRQPLDAHGNPAGPYEVVVNTR